jgi:hypothetical protein
MFREGMCAVLDNGSQDWIYVNRHGKACFSPVVSHLAGCPPGGLLGGEHFDLLRVADGLVAFLEVSVGPGDTMIRRYGFMSSKGDIVIAPKFADVNRFSGGIASCAVNDPNRPAHQPWGHEAPKDASRLSWGAIDADGRTIVPFKYEYISSLEDGLASFCIDDKWGYMDQSGEEVISARFVSAWPFYNGVAIVVLQGDTRYSVIDKSGRVVIRTEVEAFGF